MLKLSVNSNLYAINAASMFMQEVNFTQVGSRVTEWDEVAD